MIDTLRRKISFEAVLMGHVSVIELHLWVSYPVRAVQPMGMSFAAHVDQTDLLVFGRC